VYVKCKQRIALFCVSHVIRGHAVAQLIEAPRFKPEGRGFDFFLLKPSGRSTAGKGGR
jgi:hypothetical protein